MIGCPCLPSIVLDRSCWVDVRDLAYSHVLALEREEAGGKRLIVSAGPYRWQDFGMHFLVDFRSDCSSLHVLPLVNEARKFAPGIPVGNTSYTPPEVYPLNYDTSRAAKLLGISYRTKEEMTRDTIADFKQKGWL